MYIVLECPESLRKGDYFGKLADFEYVQRLRRERSVLDYLARSVGGPDRSGVKKAIEVDLSDIGIYLDSS